MTKDTGNLDGDVKLKEGGTKELAKIQEDQGTKNVEKQNIAKKTEVIVEEKGQAKQESIIVKAEHPLSDKEKNTRSKEESILSPGTIKQISEGSLKIVDSNNEISLSIQDPTLDEIVFKKIEDCQPIISISPHTKMKAQQKISKTTKI